MMKQEFYSIFYSKTKNQVVSKMLAKLLYVVYIIKFSIKNILTKRRKINVKNPRKTISEVYPKPSFSLDISNPPINFSVDISVVIPVYNYKTLIVECINSVLHQKTKYKLEIIIVDDGSTDGSSEICDSYKDKENVKVIHQNNLGIGGARNTGINNACGKYIMFVDCDDIVHEDFIDTMLDEAYKTNNDVVICGYNLVKKQGGKTISIREVEYSEYNLCGYRDAEDRIMNYQGLPWNKIYKREAFNQIRYIQGYWYEDTIIHFLVFRVCKSFSYINKPLYDYMWYEKNFSHVQSKVVPKSLERYWLLEVMAEETERLELKTDEEFYRLLLRHSGALLYNGICDFDDKVKTAAFLSTCCFIERYKPHNRYYLTFFEKKLEKALLNKDISKWEMVAKYI